MTQQQPASLELRSLEVTLAQQEILRKIELSILPGELFVLLGGAASGKSTLLRSIAGLDPVTAGEIWIDDQQITHLGAQRFLGGFVRAFLARIQRMNAKTTSDARMLPRIKCTLISCNAA